MTRGLLDIVLYRLLLPVVRLPLSVLHHLWTVALVFYRAIYNISYLHSSRLRHQQPQEADGSLLPSAKSDLYQEIYKYASLPGPRCIRVLHIKDTSHRSLGGRRGTIECELHVVSLDKHMLIFPYRAISYSWDDQKPDRYILCNGKRLAITKNCEDIIRHMLLRERLFVWIDAVCINQSSAEEKSGQIPLMTEIYQRAHTVNIWLGQPTEGIDLAWSYVWLFWCCVCLPKFVGDRFRKILYRIIEARGHAPYFLDLLRRSWWRRVWTIQESVFIPTEHWYNPCPILVNCGRLEMPLDCLSGALISFTVEHNVYHQSAYSINHKIWTHYLAIHSRFFLEKPVRLEWIMYRSKACQATDPRDRVYGLYGIMQHLGIELSPPSYDKTKDDVFWGFTMEAVQITQSLCLLGLVGGPVSGLKAPSWVPDYSGRFLMGDMPPKGIAAGGLKSTFQFSDNGRILNVAGILVDIIDARSTRGIWQASTDPTLNLDGDFVNLEEGYEQTVAAYREWISILHDHLSPLMERYGDANSLMLAFGRALTLGVLTIDLIIMVWTWTSVLDKDLDRSEYLKAVEQNPEIRSHFHDNPARRWMTESEEWQTLCALKIHVGTQFLNHLIWMHAAEKSIFVTRKGFIGSSNLSVNEGDFVCLLSGFERPMILRSSDDFGRWTVVGPAYADGMMNGELWDSTRTIMIPIS